MDGSKNTAATMHYFIHCLKIFHGTKFIHCNYIRRHGTKKHPHSHSLFTPVYHICTYAKIILRYSTAAGCYLRTFIYHPYFKVYSACLISGNQANTVPEQGSLSNPNRRYEKRIPHALFRSYKGKNILCTSNLLMCNSYIQ